MTGLAVMGRNLARNLARNGIRVAVHNRTTSRAEALVEEFGDEGDFTLTRSLEDARRRPRATRRIIVMVKAGEATDAVIDELTPLLDEGDIVADAGNAHFRDTVRRHDALAEKGIRFAGVGVSGGEVGALEGPSIMPGCDADTYGELGPFLEIISAHVDDEPCCTLVGPDGAGHFVKMVHNGIEYSDMQLVAESYDLLRVVLGREPAAIADTFREWNDTELESYLVEIAAEVLSHTDADTGRPFVDVVRDAAEQKGTGRWTVQIALDLGVPVTGIAEATMARAVSGDTAPAGGGPRGARGGRGAAGRRPRPSTTCGRRSTPRRSSRTPRASTSSARARPSTAGTSTSPTSRGSGGTAASSGPGCSATSPRPSRSTPTPRASSRPRPSPLPSPTGCRRCAASSSRRSPRASRRRSSRRCSPTSTPCAPSGCPPRSSRACATTSVRTPTSGSTATAPSTRGGPRTAPRSARLRRPSTAPCRRRSARVGHGRPHRRRRTG